EQAKLTHHTVFEQLKHTVHGMKKELDQKDLELSAAHQKKNSIEKKMTTVSNAREDESLQQEQKNIDTTIGALETAITQEWDPYEKAKAALISQEKEYLEKSAHIATQEKKIHEQLEAVQETLGFLSRDRQNKTKDVRPDWLEMYEGLRKNVNNPVVKITSA